ncbi:hypothetical protein PPYR_10903 [Photinus pyralis]|uniref:MPN domain-containing protein n=2 Tax=Photinus pyralis TaxID=7054 RepID=A0A1Y1LYE3_PHOPY|nr:ER membrane protein complex subunit 8/9 homolog [Photinus pyralis]KAB0796842.1 hypothetical protein PPYR_10903 [Photinus pyralis]
MSDIIISCKAYCKIILHAAKYPHCSINGVLLAKSSTKKEIEFVDAIPLFHNALNLIPMAEIALAQIDQVASRQGLVIAGYYTAHENLQQNSLEKAYHRISEKIAENFSGACLFVVDNRKLSNQLDSLALKVAQFSDGKYRTVDVNNILLEPSHTLNVCTSLLEQKSYKSLVDFDNHLDNVSLDWINNAINEEIEEIM